jgi:hypothetical protein
LGSLSYNVDSSECKVLVFIKCGGAPGHVLGG